VASKDVMHKLLGVQEMASGSFFWTLCKIPAKTVVKMRIVKAAKEAIVPKRK
jgi:hypothetical protein